MLVINQKKVKGLSSGSWDCCGRGFLGSRPCCSNGQASRAVLGPTVQPRIRNVCLQLKCPSFALGWTGHLTHNREKQLPGSHAGSWSSRKAPQKFLSQRLPEQGGFSHELREAQGIPKRAEGPGRDRTAQGE